MKKKTFFITKTVYFDSIFAITEAKHTINDKFVDWLSARSHSFNVLYFIYHLYILSKLKWINNNINKTNLKLKNAGTCSLTKLVLYHNKFFSIWV